LLLSFTSPPPPPIYPRSLHDALPISNEPPSSLQRNVAPASPVNEKLGELTCEGFVGFALIVGAAGGVRSIVHLYSVAPLVPPFLDRKSTRLNSSHGSISYAVCCLKKK